MLFTLQKIIWFLVMPPASLFLVLLVGVAVSWKRRMAGSLLILAGLVLFYLLSIAPVADVLLEPLERAAFPLQKIPATADAVVVPGGGSVDLAWCGASPVPNAETMTRLVKGVELAKRMNIPLVLAGGNGEPFATVLNDADVMADAAYAMGMSRNRMIVENRSRNTLENSHAVRRLVKGNRIILATSAYYMKRADAMFTRRGFTVIPAPTYHLVQTRKSGPASLIPRAGIFANSTVALAEWLSMAWWRIRGEM
ncbi:MAG TPA: ElyC/SanA/YdcF family protein [Geobacteraceae bacterium]|nr:ElyC/SanA/YdcF family protein [Geobacteraceae bacterium]